MSDKTAIEWCDSTFNAWSGCTKIGPGCDHCYAETLAKRAPKSFGQWGVGAPRKRTSVANWKLPIKWNAEPFFDCPDCGFRGATRLTNNSDQPLCANCGQLTFIARRRVFVNSLADWLDNEVEIEWLVDLLDLIRQTPNNDYLLLSKRTGLWRSRIELALRYAIANGREALADWLQSWLNGKPPANVWLGATIVNQPEADRDVPKLLAIPARVLFVSVGPMLGPVDLTKVCDRSMKRALWINSIEPKEANPAHAELVAMFGEDYSRNRIVWVICEGEASLHARPMHPDWVRSLRDQCAEFGAAFLFKQWGEWTPGENVSRRAGTVKTADWWNNKWDFSTEDLSQDDLHRDDEPDLYRVGKKAAGRMLDGRIHNEFPQVAA